MSAPVIGFIGFGEAAHCFAQHLSTQGFGKTVAFASGGTNRPPYSAAFRARAEEAGVELLDSLDAVLARADLVFSAVVVATAADVGTAIANGIKPGTLVVDINASTPSAKMSIAGAVQAGGGYYVDANLMGAVSIYGVKVPLYCSGGGVERFSSLFTPLGFSIENAGDRPGAAAAVKMLRSVVTKGIEALLIEAMTAATVAGVRAEALRGICGPMDATQFSAFADMCIKTDVLHAERRAVEIDGVAQGIRELGLDPVMTEATSARLRSSAALGQRDSFAARKDYTADDVLDAYDLAMKGAGRQ